MHIIHHKPWITARHTAEQPQQQGSVAAGITGGGPLPAATAEVIAPACPLGEARHSLSWLRRSLGAGLVVHTMHDGQHLPSSAIHQPATMRLALGGPVAAPGSRWAARLGRAPRASAAAPPPLLDVLVSIQGHKHHSDAHPARRRTCRRVTAAAGASCCGAGGHQPAQRVRPRHPTSRCMLHLREYRCLVGRQAGAAGQRRRPGSSPPPPPQKLTAALPSARDGR